MIKKLVAEITQEDVGTTKATRVNGTGQVHVKDLLGRVLPLDVGKRIYRVNGILQVENQEQLEKRLGRKPIL